MEQGLAELIDSKKKLYGKVFSVPLDHSTDCIFRPLTVSEYENIEQNESLSSADAEDLIVSACVFWPEDFNLDSFPAGVISSLSEEILEKSHLSDISIAEQVLIKYREKSNTITNIMKSTILALHDVFEMTASEIGQLTFEQLCEKVTLAEQIIRIKKTLYDPGVELEISFGAGGEAPEEQVVAQDPTALKLQQALYGG